MPVFSIPPITALFPLACSGVHGGFAIMQNGEILVWCMSISLALTIAIIAGGIRRRRLSLRAPAAIVCLLTIPIFAAIAGTADCGNAASAVGFIMTGLLATLCAGEFLFWKQSRLQDAEQRRYRERQPWQEPRNPAAHDIVALTPAPLMQADSASRAELVTEQLAWDQAAASADRRDEPPPQPHRGQLRMKLAWAKLWLSLPIGVLVGLLLMVGVPRWLAPNRFFNDYAVADLLYRLPKFMQQYQLAQGAFPGSMQALIDAQILTPNHYMTASFEPSHGNSDGQRFGGVVYPCYGYQFRMLHGTEADPLAWCIDGDPEKLTHWAIIARCVDPGARAFNQLLLTDGGMLYRHLEPPPDDPQHGQYLLDAVPNALLPDGTLDSEKMRALGWLPVRQSYEYEDFESN